MANNVDKFTECAKQYLGYSHTTETGALIGIGYAILALAHAIKKQNDEKKSG